MKAPQKTDINVTAETVTLDVNDYIDWFEKVDINTLIWQAIAIIVIFYFGKEIKLLLKGVISKVPHIKSIAGVEFELSEETKKDIAEKADALDQEIEPYMVAIEKDPNMVFLNHFIEFEHNLDKLYWDVFPRARDFMRESPSKMLNDLVHAEKLDSKVLSAYHDIRSIRNEIVHGKRSFESISEAKAYIKTVFLLKNIINEGIKKFSRSNEESA